MNGVKYLFTVLLQPEWRFEILWKTDDVCQYQRIDI